jgi:hypothetical protein
VRGFNSARWNGRAAPLIAQPVEYAMNDPIPSFHPSPSRPKLKLPPGACDTHVHVFGPSKVFPFAEGRPFTPADAPKEKLFALHAMPRRRRRDRGQERRLLRRRAGAPDGGGRRAPASRFSGILRGAL